MTHDPNREFGGNSFFGRAGGMWGWIIALAAVVVLGIIVWAAVDTGPEVAETVPPATQPAEAPSTVGTAPATDSAPASGTETEGINQPSGATTPGTTTPPSGSKE